MSRLRLLSAAALLAVAANAHATSFIVTTDAVVGALKATSDATSDITSSFKDDKIVLAARDDAASFVASEGSIRGVKLERSHSPSGSTAERNRRTIGPGHPDHLSVCLDVGHACRVPMFPRWL